MHVIGEVCRPVIASPASLLVEKNRPAAARYHVRLRSVADESLTIKSAEPNAQAVSCEVDVEHNEIRVQVEANAELLAAAVEIHAEVGEATETLRVPLVEF
jgi:hypothetical protein